jgi:hypothetical protein
MRAIRALTTAMPARDLLYYLTRYAIRKNEDKQPGGNLSQATYSSYNGGPSHLIRYRAAKPNPALKKSMRRSGRSFRP